MKLASCPRPRPAGAVPAARPRQCDVCRPLLPPVRAKPSRSGEAKAPPATPLPTRLASSATALAAAAVMALGGLIVSPPPLLLPASAEVSSLAPSPPPTTDDGAIPPPSPDPALFAVQRTLYAAWDALDRGFVDANFGGRDWRADLRAGLRAVASAPSPAAARGEMAAMVARLGDPYTRLLPAPEYASYKTAASGEIQGVGLLVAADPGGRLVVVAPVDGGPADRAGVRPGDQLVAIDDQALPPGMGSEAAAALLRGAPGSSVTLRVARAEQTSDGGVAAAVPGVARRAPRPPPTPAPRYSVRTFALQREAVELSPVATATLPLPGAGRRASHGGGGGLLGYVRLLSFTDRAPGDVAAALADLDAAGARAYVLDLRGNPGGLVRSALGVARLWLAPASPVFNVVGRDGAAAAERVVLDGEAPPPSSSSPPTTASPPLAVLVDHGSASAAEILAGALRDNGRAAVIGDRTFGKGAIQAVVPLDDGSGLSLSIARYTTPAGDAIDHVGLRPPRACRAARLPPAIPAPRAAVAAPGAQEALAAALDADPCMRVAAGVLASQL